MCDVSPVISCWPRLHYSHLMDCIVIDKLISQSPEGISFVIMADVLLGVVALMDSGSVRTPKLKWFLTSSFFTGIFKDF